MKSAIESITIVSEHRGNVVFDVKLRDGAYFRADAGKKLVHHWTKFAGVHSSVPFIVKEKTKEEVKRHNTMQTVAGFFLVLFFVYQCSGNSGEHGTRTMSSSEKNVEALIYCKDLVKSRLKAPHTADFPWAIEAKETPSNYFTVNSYVDAHKRIRCHESAIITPAD